MKTVIGGEPNLAALPNNLRPLRSDGDTKHKNIRSAEDQLGWPTLDPRRATTKPLRVLIIEDDLTIGPLLAETLEQLGHVVCGLEVDVASAVKAAKRRHPDLMIVDIGLGEASGISAVEQILKDGFVPHVFVTGDDLHSLSLGPEAVLIQKPYRSSDLVDAIARAIDGKASRETSGSA